MPLTTQSYLSILATFTVKPEQRTRFLTLFETILEKTRQEAGCIRYELHTQADDNNRFVVIETWQDEAALQAHLQQPYLQDMFAKQHELMTCPVELTRWSPIL